jgi:anti-sigma B factor antagonist
MMRSFPGAAHMDSKLDIQERQDGDVTVLTLTGEITLDDGDLLFRKRIHELVERGRTQVVLDLAGVTFIDSAGVGMLAAKLKTVREKGGDLRLARISTRGQRLFGIMKILIIFQVFDDEASAIRSFDWKG